MKKGQKVRILRTNQVATIVEVELIRKGGKVNRYCHLKTCLLYTSPSPRDA